MSEEFRCGRVDEVRHVFFASRNPHKTRELMAILGPGFAIEDLRDHPEIAEVIENGATLVENARLKAVAMSGQLPGLVLADDSGLEVDSLGGAPGVYSARFAGDGATDESNRRKLLDELARLPPGSSRVARFRCVLALAQSGEAVAIFGGEIEGQIVREERGDGGFGYDPLFQPNGFEKTFAELSPADKNAISHRAVAGAQLLSFFRTGCR